MQPNATLARYLNPWKFKRLQEEMKRIAELRERDGDHCRRCRRQMRFDLPNGHDLAPKIETGAAEPSAAALQAPPVYLCHTRCNAAGVDHTLEVKERVRSRQVAAASPA